jgi:hypothetical protein
MRERAVFIRTEGEVYFYFGRESRKGEGRKAEDGRSPLSLWAILGTNHN